MKPRVLFLSPQPFFQWRGSPIRVKHNLQALSDLGYAVDLVTLPFGEAVEMGDLQIHRVAGFRGVKNVPIGPSFWKLMFDFKIYRLASRLLRQNEYQLIHGIEEAGFLGVWLAKKHGLPLIYEKHSDPASYRKNFLRNRVMDVYARIEAYTIRRAKAVIATGPGLADAVRKIYPACFCTHLFDIPSSLGEAEADAVQTRRAQLQQQPKEILATYVGSFAVYQGIDLLFDAIPAALAACPRLRFVIIGGTDEEIRAYQAQLKTAGVADTVRFIGNLSPESLPATLGASDLLLSPRISGNNTPLKLLDYLKAGRAIVATDLPANRLILDDSMAAFSALTPTAFAAAIADLALNDTRRDQKASSGRRLIDEVYNFPNYRQKLKTVYDTVLPST